MKAAIASAPIFPMTHRTLKDRLLAFWDFFVLFSGVSTASNLSRTRREPIINRGLFLFRSHRTR